MNQNQINEEAERQTKEYYGITDWQITKPTDTTFSKGFFSGANFALSLPVSIKVEFDEPILECEGGEWLCYSAQFPGMVCGGQTKLEAFEGFMTSVTVKLAFDNNIPISAPPSLK